MPSATRRRPPSKPSGRAAPPAGAASLRSGPRLGVSGVPVRCVIGHRCRRTLSVSELDRIPQLMQIYERYSEWEWRFGKSPSFSHSLEHKFGWALVDVQLEVANGVVARGRVYSDCLLPSLIDALNDELAAGAGSLTYDSRGVADLCSRARARLEGEASLQVARDCYLPELQEWLTAAL
mmetsp:Transcript_25293/g.75283  ORF Transcript_25293/g.75283 Transcript_25293/m.75283 type:complete len:179 (-) Transcript_25293:70-606(-)